MKIAMKFRVFLMLFCLIPTLQTTIAQDYRAINTDATSYFIDSISKDIIALRIDSTSTSGADNLYYGFRQMKQTDYGCYTINGGSWIGDEVTEKPDGTFIFTVYPFSPPDSSSNYRILSRRVPGQPWIFYTYHTINHHIEAVVTEVRLMSFLGITDSVKTISLTCKDAVGQVVSDPVNNQKILLSKNYGLIRLPKFDDFIEYNRFYDIVGKTNPKTGITNLTTLAIYDFQPGDELHSVWHDQGSPVPFTIMDGATIMRVLERISPVSGDSVTYRMEICQLSRYQFSPTEYSYYHSFDTVYKTYSCPGAPLLEAEPLEPVPIYNDMTTYSFMGFLNDPAIPLYDLPVKFIRNSMLWTEQDGCYSMITFDGCWYSDIYIQGLGGPYHNCNDFGWGPSYNLLKYYKKGNITWGSPLVCDSILTVGVGELNAEKALSIYPNPSPGSISVIIPDGIQLPCRLELFDLSGRLMTGFQQLQVYQNFDISGLPPGIYGYRIRSANGDVFQGKIIRQ